MLKEKHNSFRIKKMIYILGFIAMSTSLAGFFKLGTKSNLKFKSDGTFKIVQFTDIHEGNPINMKTIELMDSVLDKEKPDLVVLTGDNVDGRKCSFYEAQKAAVYVAQPMEKRKIPWVTVLGNHDTEHIKIKRKDMTDIYNSFKYNLGGSNNYNILINNSKNTNPVFNIYMLDSGSYALGGYGFIDLNQVKWYIDTSLELKKNYNKTIPSIMFFHIPIYEYKKDMDSSRILGERNETECTQIVNTGLFFAAERMGDVKGMFVGHDHTNSYIRYLNGIMLGYGRCTGFDACSSKNFQRGARVFLLNEKEPNKFQTWIVRYDDKTGKLQ